MGVERSFSDSIALWLEDSSFRLRGRLQGYPTVFTTMISVLRELVRDLNLTRGGLPEVRRHLGDGADENLQVTLKSRNYCMKCMKLTSLSGSNKVERLTEMNCF